MCTLCVWMWMWMWIHIKSSTAAAATYTHLSHRQEWAARLANQLRHKIRRYEAKNKKNYYVRTRSDLLSFRWMCVRFVGASLFFVYIFRHFFIWIEEPKSPLRFAHAAPYSETVREQRTLTKCDSLDDDFLAAMERTRERKIKRRIASQWKRRWNTSLDTSFHSIHFSAAVVVVVFVVALISHSNQKLCSPMFWCVNDV